LYYPTCALAGGSEVIRQSIQICNRMVMGHEFEKPFQVTMTHSVAIEFEVYLADSLDHTTIFYLVQTCAPQGVIQAISNFDWFEASVRTSTHKPNDYATVQKQRSSCPSLVLQIR
jgi:hypothetical protein